ncbi:TBC1 domain family member 5-like [Uloborus diversus]|uniref:TBC1 domain family member 5-like n=1 Tax=Uloborus diversus TaxID=327109 RepID=UPI002408FE2A|nr:TBC1 domain family member 5-like [Uloborus diversus]
MNDTSHDAYRQEWSSLFSGRYYLEQLKSTGIKGSLRNSHFRSICWKVFLECLPDDRNLWRDVTESQRQRYDEMLDKFHTNPWTTEEYLDVNVNNPLSQSCQSPWNQYFQDSDLKITIEQDVVRTFPEIEFFRDVRIQEMMTSILFSYAREYPHVSYKQGMHELLAPLIFVLHCDQEAYLEASKMDNLELDIGIMLNPNYIEHDAFFLFSQLMEVVEAWYTMSDSPFSKNDSLVCAEPFSQIVNFGQGNTLGFKLKKIYDHLLKHHDVELFLYLENLEITPQIYGIRWLRLLFGREFSIHDLLVIWDAIFADSISFNLVDYIFVAMLMIIRDLLLQSDYASCLRHLMHYPNIPDVHYIIELALHLRDPGSTAKPNGCCIQETSNKKMEKLIKNEKILINKSGFSKLSLSSNPSATKHAETRPKSLKIPGLNASSTKEKSSSASPPLLKSGKGARNSTLHHKQHANDSMQQSDLERSEWDFEVDTDYIPGRGAYDALPCTSIKNVMESRNNKINAVDLSQSFGHFCDGLNDSSDVSLGREMVPLLPASEVSLSPKNQPTKKHFKHATKERNEDSRMLKNEITELRKMNEYCAQQISQHIEKLQEKMMCQRLLYEDEIFVALAGLKRARDILKGTVSFSEEVMEDDHISLCTLSSIAANHTSSISQGNNCCKSPVFNLDENLESNIHENDSTLLNSLPENIENKPSNAHQT